MLCLKSSPKPIPKSLQDHSLGPHAPIKGSELIHGGSRGWREGKMWGL